MASVVSGLKVNKMNENTLNEARKMIAEFIKSRRVQLMLTQQQLADKAGWHQQTIQRIEAGKFFLNLKQLLIICECLDCYFFFGEKDSSDPLIETMRDRWGKNSNN